MENVAADPDPGGGHKSREVKIGYTFIEGTSNSGKLDLTKKRVHVKHLKKKDENDKCFFENASFAASIKHTNFLGGSFIDPLNEANTELYLVSDPFDLTFNEYADQLKKKGISFYMPYEVPCEDEGGGLKYIEIHPIYRKIVKALVDSLFFLHEEKEKCIKDGFTAENLVVQGDNVCLDITGFVKCTPKGRTRDMLALKSILDKWFPRTIGAGEDELPSPGCMSHFRMMLAQFDHFLETYGQRVKSYFSNHDAVMDTPKRLQFIKYCSEKSFSPKLKVSYYKYKQAVMELGPQNGWVDEAKKVKHGPLVDVLTHALIIVHGDDKEENTTVKISYTSSGDPPKKFGRGDPQLGNFLVNRSLITFWRNCGTHLQDYMPRHMLAKRKRIELEKEVPVQEGRRANKRTHNKKGAWLSEDNDPSQFPRVQERALAEKNAKMSIFEDADIELSIMALYDVAISQFYHRLFVKNILHAFL